MSGGNAWNALDSNECVWRVYVRAYVCRRSGRWSPAGASGQPSRLVLRHARINKVPPRGSKWVHIPVEKRRGADRRGKAARWGRIAEAQSKYPRFDRPPGALQLLRIRASVQINDFGVGVKIRGQPGFGPLSPQEILPFIPSSCLCDCMGQAFAARHT